MSEPKKPDQILAAVLAATENVEGKKTLPCPDAFRLASDLGVDLIDIGKICDQNQVKIVKCQLGCFD